MSSLKSSLQQVLQRTKQRQYLRSLRENTVAYEKRLNADMESETSSVQMPAFSFELKNVCEHVRVAIVIPSKDHPEMLARCLESINRTCGVGEQDDASAFSLVDNTAACRITALEVIVVDNGSTSENRKKINEILNRTFQASSCVTTEYLYEKEDFNFSRMCNRGAQASSSDLILFLNDDVEALSLGWLPVMAQAALTEGVGAVGAKLLYPDEVMKDSDSPESTSDATNARQEKVNAQKEAAGAQLKDKSQRESRNCRTRFIQHCGVVNTRVGPMHVFGRLSDDVSYANGYNRNCVPAMAVTGACLMMRKALFDELGGFSEELAVAFNDVDLCYTLVDRGYVNLCMNQVTLLHYESFSRGDDSVHAEKRLRLMSEYRTLMSRHISLIGRDLFFPKAASTEEENPFPDKAITEAFDADTLPVTRLQPFVIPESVREDQVLFSVTEYADRLWLWSADDTASRPLGKDAKDLLVWGYTFVIGSDNALYKRTLLFKKVEPNGTEFQDVDDEILSCPVHDAYRPDIARRIPDQINAQMCGFYVKIAARDLPAGLYKIGVLAEKAFSSEKLLSWRMSIIKS